MLSLALEIIFSANAETLCDRLYIKQNAVSAPRPDFPFGFRGNHIIGSGIYMFHINAEGTVIAVTVEHGSGNGMLDVEAVKTLRRWRFKPDAPANIAIPVTWGQGRVLYR